MRFLTLFLIIFTAETFSSPLTDLTSGDMNKIEYAARKLTRYPSSFNEVNNLLAEFVNQHYDVSDPDVVDTVSWVAKALGQTGTPRTKLH